MSKDDMGRALHTKSKIFLTIHDLLWTEDNTTGKKLNKGRNIYPFEFFLPVAIPSTLKVGNNIKGARIKYEVKATFYTKGGAKVHSTIAEAFVSRVLPNDLVPEEFQNPVQELRRQIYFCGVWSLKCNLHMPKRIFTEGETVPIDIHVENNTGLNITEIQCILYQTVRVKCTLTKHYRFQTPISRLLLPVLIENGEENTFDNILMPVPIPLEASSLHHQEKCLNRVRIAYFLKVILKTPTFAFKEITVSCVPLCITTLQKTETPRLHGCPAALSHQGSIHEVFDKVVRDARELICIIKEH
ncbi:uncharacterized protein LOC106175725 [Lingula anatina]|uniref:Uncharacterized protein LOC106175725 n=1 Tax=Lingula anatina TaxID=7574 RepID=A0A1S3JT64_LINAN|nr:uncharacterized protein LOC106175725 [Lingula anatina]|eukprot:XP_013413301.1 uncharacterized protein LOC106175725 [Lingula anatina]